VVIRRLAGASEPRPGSYDADVVILSLDRPRETLEAIASVFAQQGALSHLWVVDQGSRPDALRAVAQAVDRRPDATLATADANLGVAGGRNAGSALGRGRVIACLDNDAEFSGAHVLAAAAAALDADASLAAIGLRILVHATGRDDLSSWGYPQGLLARAAESFDAATFVGAGHAVRRAAWDAAGGYDEALFFTWEEYDFCLRAIDLGWRVRYRGDLAVRHKVCSDRRVDWSRARWFQFVRNRLYIERKWGARLPALAVRAAAYMAKGARNGLPLQTACAVAAAARMRVGPAATMSAAGRAYLASCDAAHRGGLAVRLRREVLSPLRGHGAGLQQP
jgi:GT2 family glycosyltransferase